MQNAVAASVFASAPPKRAASKWVQHLASADCQEVVARSAVVMPALASAVETSRSALSETGLDITAYTDQIENGTTFPFPAVLNSAEIQSTMTSAMDNVLAFNAEPSSLTRANEEINALFD